jgi:pyrimidine operon attenuation protein / uracil phosphoribosyltransferase
MGEAAGTYRKVRLLDAVGMARAISRMSHEVVEAEGGTEGFVLIGIRTRGVPLAQRLASEIERTPLAQRLASEIERTEGVKVPVGLLDITLYRDDLTTVASSPVLKKTEIPFKVEGRAVILCDDVLFTGRTVRAAMDAILDFGRPRKILLAVLVDRGRRELPIEAQYIGKKIATSATEIVSVTFKETDGEDDVWLLDRETAKPAPKAAPAKSPSGRRRPRKK